MTPSLVIFDCDGVLVDSEPITNREMAADLTAHGLPVTTEECMSLFVGGTIALVAEQARARGANLPDDWVPDFYDRMCVALAEEVEAIPGVAEVVASLQSAGTTLAIGSNGPMRKMEVTLGRTGLWPAFEQRIYSAHDIGIAKPDTRFYAHIAGALGHAKPNTVVIEDSASGVKAATGAGIRCLGYAGDTPAAKLQAEGAEIFTDMAELPGLLGIAG
ncbi:MAG: HAD family phosphatase [Pseudomonadota bacterium]